MNVKRYLTEAQVKLHGNCDAALAEGLIVDIDELVGVEVTLEALESLSACRALLGKHQWILEPSKQFKFCPECMVQMHKTTWKHCEQHGWYHDPDCAIATALQGVGGE